MMAKAIVCPSSISVNGNNLILSYSVGVVGPPNSAYGSDYTINTGISVASNITAWQTKIIAEVLAKGVTILNTDIITFGLPA